MENLKIHRLAHIMLDQLSASEQAAIEKRLTSLAGKAPDTWPARIVRKYPHDPSMYLLRVDGSLRAVVRAVKGQPMELLDIVRQEALDFFAKSKN